MNIRLAQLDDLDTLIQARLDFCQAMFGPPAEADAAGWARELRPYFTAHLGRDGLAFIAEIEGRAVGVAFLALTERPASPAAPNGLIGEVGNVWTYPEYRGRGIAAAIMKRIIEEAERRGVCRLDLSASPAGQKVYEKMGFVEQTGHTRMNLRLRPALEG